jgi:hypothetical protein
MLLDNHTFHEVLVYCLAQRSPFITVVVIEELVVASFRNFKSVYFRAMTQELPLQKRRVPRSNWLDTKNAPVIHQKYMISSSY